MQPLNAPSPICVTLAGIVTEVMLEQPRNASASITVTPAGTSKAPSFRAGQVISRVMALSKRTPSALQKAELPAATVISAMLLQLEKAPSPMDATPAGTVTRESAVLANAFAPMIVTLSGIVISARARHM